MLTLLGELDMSGAPTLRSAVMQAVADGSTRIVLDLSALDFIDSAGLGAVIGALKRVRSHDGELEVVCDEPRIRRVFEMCSLDRVFALHRTFEGVTS